MTFSKGKAVVTVDRWVTAKEGRGCDYKGTQRAVGDDELFCFLRIVVILHKSIHVLKFIELYTKKTSILLHDHVKNKTLKT